MKYVYIETYGCSANQAHSEMIEGSLSAGGFEKTENPGKADVIIINTCIVKSPTENRIRERIKSFVEKYPKKRLIIAGCASDVGMFRDVAPDAEFVSSHRSEDVVGMLKGSPDEARCRKRANPLVNITEIASGCLGNCSYCIVRLARGRLKSRSVRSIAEEVKKAVIDGCKEIWLTSQDCGCYGKDIGISLAVLIRSISALDGDFRIRVGMMNPNHIKPMMKDMVSAFGDEKVYKFIHIPVQSGSDRILKMMKRQYKARDFEAIVGAFRESMPDISVSTDVIVGFPGETEEDFEKTRDLVNRVGPDVVNLSKFGARPGTEAAKMEQVANRTIKERSVEMGKIVKKIAAENNRKWHGEECDIIVNESGKRKNQFMGRNRSYKAVIVESGENLMGRSVRVTITGSGITHLEGEIRSSV